jgi:hypothetical protein
MTKSQNKCFTPQINKQINDKCMNFKLILPKGLTPDANVFVSVSSFTGYEECLSKICQPRPAGSCIPSTIFNSSAFTYTYFKKYTGTNDININCLDKNYKYKIKVSIIDNVGIINNTDWFDQPYDDRISEYPNMKILVKTLSVNNKTNKTIYLTDMVQLIATDDLDVPCPDADNLIYANPIGGQTFLGQYRLYFKEQIDLIQSLNSFNLQPLKITLW